MWKKKDERKGDYFILLADFPDKLETNSDIYSW